MFIKNTEYRTFQSVILGMLGPRKVPLVKGSSVSAFFPLRCRCVTDKSPHRLVIPRCSPVDCSHPALKSQEVSLSSLQHWALSLYADSVPGRAPSGGLAELGPKQGAALVRWVVEVFCVKDQIM